MIKGGLECHKAYRRLVFLLKRISFCMVFKFEKFVLRIVFEKKKEFAIVEQKKKKFFLVNQRRFILFKVFFFRKTKFLLLC